MLASGLCLHYSCACIKAVHAPSARLHQGRACTRVMLARVPQAGVHQGHACTRAILAPGPCLHQGHACTRAMRAPGPSLHQRHARRWVQLALGPCLHMCNLHTHNLHTHNLHNLHMRNLHTHNLHTHNLHVHHILLHLLHAHQGRACTRRQLHLARPPCTPTTSLFAPGPCLPSPPTPNFSTGGVPVPVPVPVTLRMGTARCPPLPAWARGGSASANPKSPMAQVPSSRTSTFWLLRSRCTTLGLYRPGRPGVGGDTRKCHGGGGEVTPRRGAGGC